MIRLVAFDVDGTLVHSNSGKVVWQLFNQHYCPDDDCDARYGAFLRNEIDYAQWVALDIGGWQRAGARQKEMRAIISRELSLTPGALETVAAVCAAGIPAVVISGTLDLTLDVLLPQHPFDEVRCSAVEFDQAGAISGWTATPYDNDGKAVALREMAAARGVSIAQTAFIGDSVNDLPVMRAAGCAIAYEPKREVVAEAADHTVVGDMRQCLPLLGVAAGTDA